MSSNKPMFCERCKQTTSLQTSPNSLQRSGEDAPQGQRLHYFSRNGELQGHCHTLNSQTVVCLNGPKHADVVGLQRQSPSHLIEKVGVRF